MYQVFFPTGIKELFSRIIVANRKCFEPRRGQHFPAGPINNGDKVHKSFIHRNIGRVQRPDLIGSVIQLQEGALDTDMVQVWTELLIGN